MRRQKPFMPGPQTCPERSLSSPDRGGIMPCVVYRDFAHRRIEPGQCLFARVRQAQFDKCHMIQPQADRIKQRAVSGDDPFGLKCLNTCLSRGLRQSDSPGEVRNRDTTIPGKNRQYRLIKPVHPRKVPLH